MNKTNRFLTILNNLKVLFPSWELFDIAGENYILLYRFEIKSNFGNENQWIQLPQKINRNIFSIFYNPIGNLNLLIKTNIEMLVEEIDNINLLGSEIDPLQVNINYQIIKKLIMLQIKENIKLKIYINSENIKKEVWFQFKIVIEDKETINNHEFYKSDILKMEIIND